MEVHTERCTIRYFEEQDIDAFMVYRNDMDWMRYQGFKGLTKQEYINVLLGNGSLQRGLQLAISHNKSNELIGDLYLKQEEDICWIGYSICRAKAQQGYAYEAVTAMIASLREQGITCLKAGVENGNTASIALLNKLKFLYEGTDDGEEIYVKKFRRIL